MTADQARKLLGGYATNSLTDAERTALFEAALDDQELFDALQREQALKELLADPVSRGQIQQALVEESASVRGSQRSRGWIWGGLAAAVAAGVLVVAVIRSNAPTKVEMARVAPAPSKAAEEFRPASPAVAEPKLDRPATRPRAANQPGSVLRDKDAVEDKVVIPLPANAPAPPPPATPQSNSIVQSGSQGQLAEPRVQSFRQEQAGALQTRTAPMAGLAGSRTDSQGPLLRYTLTRRAADGSYSPLGTSVSQLGDSLRLGVLPGVAGYLSLFQQDAAGEWKQLSPQAEQGVLVSANATQTLPDSPITVKDTELKLRLMLVPLAPTPAGQTPAPLVIDITIPPGRAR
jgi:cytoskeletal protein RodZ